LGCYEQWRARGISGGPGGERKGWQQALGFPVPVLRAYKPVPSKVLVKARKQDLIEALDGTTAHQIPPGVQITYWVAPSDCSQSSSLVDDSAQYCKIHIYVSLTSSASGLIRTVSPKHLVDVKEWTKEDPPHYNGLHLGHGESFHEANSISSPKPFS
jgi:hypothetical protein